ncbi:ATP-dependent DNA helicase Q-like SIM [Phragmites australis]|uniref:ATP-dependent DNA helicase Q-like SIM n=1 Tax=Phragmites australis TaxID=29695 RepID=UPI002D771BE3|nr:ATP-dependent DNA helicase Q-like SIM [Phragmites australis]
MEPGAVGSDVSADGLIAELLDMGFEFDDISAAVGVVGPRRAEVLELVLGVSGASQARQTRGVAGHPASSTAQRQPPGKGTKSSNPRERFRQSSITDHLASAGVSRKESGRDSEASTSFPCSSAPIDPRVPVGVDICSNLGPESQSLVENSRGEFDQRDKISAVLQKHFGFSCLKDFQKEALDAWFAHKDCLVLAATGSGKSLCFQIPALLSTKIVVVISPLISLMHDQCLKLATHGISACFLGSGQPDSHVEGKAMAGMYKIVYVCPETILRLMEPLKKLAEKPGIALFAIDEVHCVSKWGHDFRPDYRRLSVLRENFNSSKLKFLKHDIPLMALTATATVPVREDIVKSLKMSVDTAIVLTSFLRPNLRFNVKHSKTSASSYGKDFQELIGTYNSSRNTKGKGQKILHGNDPEIENSSYESLNDSTSDDEDEDADSASRADKNVGKTRTGTTLVKENAENELDLYPGVDDFDVSCGEFLECSQPENSALPAQPNGTSTSECLDQGPTIVYVPTRKETVELASYLCKSGLRAAAYNAKMPKSHLRQVHQQFHCNDLEVVVATIAFGMGIDKSNVRRIIHYGFPQSLEAYYQEAGRAGRDGKLSDCILYCNLLRAPTLLPNKRSEEQTKVAYRMLRDCFHYALNTSTCRAKILVKYFGEEFGPDGCRVCDVCINGPQMHDFKEEAVVLMNVLQGQSGHETEDRICSSVPCYRSGRRMFGEAPNFRMVVSYIREKLPRFAATDKVWWQGLARILEGMGYIREAAETPRVLIQYPELTEDGLKFLSSQSEEALYAYPDAAMLLATNDPEPFSTFSEWGRGWADPEIRRQRLAGKKTGRSKRKRRSRQHPTGFTTAKERLAAILSKRRR